MRNISKILMCLLIGASVASCTGSPAWMANKDQATINTYIEKRIDSGKYDLQGLCDRVRRADFRSGERPSNVTLAANARKARLAFEQIADKRGSNVKCPKPTADELRVHIYDAERMRALRDEAFDSVGKAAAAAMGYRGSSSSTSSSSTERLDELERKQKEDKFWRDYDCSNAAWRKGYC